MLRKLFKYDLKNTCRLLLPATLLAAGVTVIGCAAIAASKYIAETGEANDASFITYQLLISSLSVVAFASFAALVVYLIFSFITVCVNFYKSLFTDEGYLTFTLPVKTSSILLSKLLCAVTCCLISILAFLLFAFFFLGIASADTGEIFSTAVVSDIILSLRQYAELLDSDAVWCIVLAVISLIASGIEYILLVFLSITIGSTVAKKAKIAASVGFYFALNTVQQFITNFVSPFSVGIFTVTTAGVSRGILVFLIISAIVTVSLAVAEFFIINAIIKHKLNLE